MPAPTPAPFWLRVVKTTAQLAILVFCAMAVWVLGHHLEVFDNKPYVVELAAILGVFAATLGFTVRGRRPGVQRVLSAIMIGVCLATVWAHAGHRLRRYGNRRQISNWGTYHYYIGSKYYRELGYHDLYVQTMAVDPAEDGPFREVTRIRDLRNYRHVPSAPFRAVGPSETFSDERWAEFEGDVNYFIRITRPTFWRDVMMDRGYNPTPVWNMIGSALTNTFSIRVPWQQTVLMTLDLATLTIAFGFSVWAYGLGRSALMLLGLMVWFGTERRIFGQIYNYDWFSAAWIALSLYRREKHFAAGCALAYSTLVRVFPGAMFVGPFMIAGAGVLKHQWTQLSKARAEGTLDMGARVKSLLRLEGLERKYKRFFGGAIVAGMILVGASMVTNAQGPRAWVGFWENIQMHRVHHVTGARRIGLQQVYTMDIVKGLEQPVRRNHPRSNLEDNSTAYRLTQLLYVGLLFMALRKTRDHDAMLISTVAVWALTLGSRYYGAILMFPLLLGVGPKGDPTDERGRVVKGAGRPAGLAFSDAALFFISWTAMATPATTTWSGREPSDPEDPRMMYLWGNLLLGVWWLLLLSQKAIGSGWGRPQLPAPAPAAEDAPAS